MLEELEAKVLEWGQAKGILSLSSPLDQHDKTIEEALEIRDGIVRYDVLESLGAPVSGAHVDIQDGIGDTVVTLILLASMYGLTLEQCLAHAYKEIKDRKGVMLDGKFVKEMSV